MIANYYINGFLLLLTILVVSVPEGLDIAASMSMALSINTSEDWKDHIKVLYYKPNSSELD